VPSSLYSPTSHEPLTQQRWSESRARAAIAEIVADAEEAFHPEHLWPPHPLDEDESDDEPLSPLACLYLGASGVVWALAALERSGAVTLQREWADVAAWLPERYGAMPDLPQWSGGGASPSLLIGESGILLVAHALAPDPQHVDRMVACARSNVDSPANDLMWGSPGTALAAQLMYDRTGDERLADAWRESVDRLWERWRDDLWLQEIYGKRWHFIGPGHGFAGNVHMLARGDLLDADRRSVLERRSLDVLRKYVRREGGLAQWPAVPTWPADPSALRTQWCHGSPGIVTSFAAVSTHDDELTELLVAGGELTWQAGPLTKGPGLCHGTAGNGYAFLKLLDRTGDERWLDRARAFGMHAVEQVRRTREEHGRGRYTLWTGDAGAAWYLWSCIAADSAMPVLDVI
jgi:hypothetical protein